MRLGFYDVLHYYTLPKPSRLGFATVHTAQQAMLNNPKWSRFEHVFYTESTRSCTLVMSIDYCTSRRPKFRTTCCRIASRPCPEGWTWVLLHSTGASMEEY